MPAINRIAAFTDSSPGSVGAGWTNGPGDFGDIAASGGFFQPATTGAPCMAGRSGGVYGLAQFCSVTVGTLAAGDSNIAAAVRWAGGANEACYFGDVYADSGGYKYGILEVDNSFGIILLASAGTGGAVSSGVVVTTEIDADGNIGLYTNEGGTDTLRLSASDATLGAGVPGFVLFGSGSATNARISSISGGTLWQDIGDYLVAVGPYTSGTGNVTPLIPTVESGAADILPILVAHSAGGQAINLGTANGFSELANSPSATGTGTAGVRVGVFANTSGAGGSAPVITDPGDHCGGLILLVKHPGGLPTVDATTNNQKGTASTSFSISGVTTTVADALVLPISGRDTDSAAAAYSGWTNANLTGLAEIFDAGTTQGNGGGLGIAAGVKSTAGAVGNTTGTVTSSINANYEIAFAPPSAGSTGTGAITLPEIAVSGAGVRQANGSGAITLPLLTVAGAGIRQANGAGAITLPEMAVAGTGARGANGEGAITLPLLEVDGAGTVGAVITGSGAIDLPQLEVAGSGVRGAVGSGAVTLPLLEVAGAGFRTAIGAGDILLPLMAVAGAGVRQANGAGAITLPTLGVAGEGTVDGQVAGAGSITLPPLEVAGSGWRTSNGVGAITLPALEVAGEGEISGSATGGGSITLPLMQVAGAGTRGVVGTGAITLPGILVSGFEVPPAPGGAYRYIGGTAFDASGRMLTSFLEPAEALPHASNFLQGLAHDATGRRYVTSWPGAVGYIAGFAVRVDGVQVVAADAVPVRAIEGLGVTARGELAVTDEPPVSAVEGLGIDALGRLSVTEKS